MLIEILFLLTAIAYLLRRLQTLLLRPVRALLRALAAPIPQVPVVSITSIQSTSVILQWDATLTPAPYNYYEIRVNGKKLLNSPRPSCMIEQLRSDLYYQIDVSAVGLHGFRSKSLPVFVKTHKQGRLSIPHENPHNIVTFLTADAEHGEIAKHKNDGAANALRLRSNTFRWDPAASRRAREVASLKETLEAGQEELRAVTQEQARVAEEFAVKQAEMIAERDRQRDIRKGGERTRLAVKAETKLLEENLRYFRRDLKKIETERTQDKEFIKAKLAEMERWESDIAHWEQERDSIATEIPGRRDALHSQCVALQKELVNARAEHSKLEEDAKSWATKRRAVEKQRNDTIKSLEILEKELQEGEVTLIEVLNSLEPELKHKVEEEIEIDAKAQKEWQEAQRQKVDCCNEAYAKFRSYQSELEKITAARLEKALESINKDASERERQMQMQNGFTPGYNGYIYGKSWETDGVTSPISGLPGSMNHLGLNTNPAVQLSSQNLPSINTGNVSEPISTISVNGNISETVLGSSPTGISPIHGISSIPMSNQNLSMSSGTNIGPASETTSPLRSSIDSPPPLSPTVELFLPSNLLDPGLLSESTLKQMSPRNPSIPSTSFDHSRSDSHFSSGSFDERPVLQPSEYHSPDNSYLGHLIAQALSPKRLFGFGRRQPSFSDSEASKFFGGKDLKVPELHEQPDTKVSRFFRKNDDKFESEGTTLVPTFSASTLRVRDRSGSINSGLSLPQSYHTANVNLAPLGGGTSGLWSHNNSSFFPTTSNVSDNLFATPSREPEAPGGSWSLFHIKNGKLGADKGSSLEETATPKLARMLFFRTKDRGDEEEAPETPTITSPSQKKRKSIFLFSKKNDSEEFRQHGSTSSVDNIDGALTENDVSDSDSVVPVPEKSSKASKLFPKSMRGLGIARRSSTASTSNALGSITDTDHASGGASSKSIDQKIIPISE